MILNDIFNDLKLNERKRDGIESRKKRRRKKNKTKQSNEQASKPKTNFSRAIDAWNYKNEVTAQICVYLSFVREMPHCRFCLPVAVILVVHIKIILVWMRVNVNACVYIFSIDLSILFLYLIIIYIFVNSYVAIWNEESKRANGEERMRKRKKIIECFWIVFSYINDIHRQWQFFIGNDVRFTNRKGGETDFI